MQVLYSVDPRDKLEKANRDQLYQFAERNGIKEIEWWMAGNQMRSILKKRGIKDLGLPEHQLGQPYGSAQPSGPVQTSSLEEMEQAQWEAQARDVRREPEKNQTRAELAKECKKRGIKMARTDTKEKLLERLSG